MSQPTLLGSQIEGAGQRRLGGCGSCQIATLAWNVGLVFDVTRDGAALAWNVGLVFDVTRDGESSCGTAIS
jgi:hypothetical protein